MNTSLSETQQLPAQEVVFFPASFAQQRLWFIDQLTPGKATYNLPGALRVRGKLDVGALERALEEVARRHETLRTRFVVAGGELQQLIEDGVSVQLPVVDLTYIAGEEKREAEAVRLAQEEAQQPFDLKQAPLFRGKLLRLGELDHVLLFTMYHIISDAWSMGILVEEVSVLYGAFSAGQPSPLPELPIQYADYSVWQRECLEGGLLEGQLAYWKEQLSGVSMLQLPADRPRPTTQSQNGATSDFVIAGDLTQELKRLAEEQGATLFMVLLAAFQILLYRYSGQPDIAVGTPIAGRRSSDTERLIGFFINTLVLRGDLSGAPGFIELLQRTKEVTLEAYAHQDVPFEKLVEVLSPERNMGSTPLFQVMIVLENTPQSDLRLGAATLQPFNTVDNGTSKFDLLLQFGEDGSGKLMGSLQYSTDLFDVATMGRFIEHYQKLLSGIADKPSQSIDVLPLLTSHERKQVIEEWNRTGMEYERQKCLPELLEEQARKTPEAIAIVSVDGQLTYAELNRQANQIGHYLRKLGVGPEERVGICVNRGRDMVAGLVGILKAGGAYVPLDGNYPQERLTYMVEDAKAGVVLTQAALVERFNGFSGRIVLLDKDRAEIERQSSENLPPNAEPENLAYVIYTSGSTGKPKGVAITHRSAVVLLHWARQAFSAEELSGVLASTSICFDLSVFEIFVPLSCGGTVFVVKDALELASAPEHNAVKLVNTVPSAIRELVRLKAIPESVQTVNLAGEALTSGLVQDVYAAKNVARVCNLYGPSEDTTYSTYAFLEKDPNAVVVPIGKPIANTQVYVVDKGMESVPVGVPGELCLGGAGLARGYWGRGDLTAERFVPDGLSGRKGERLYRTGDLVRWLADGNLEYLGRNDQQVKIRGFRIELGEIEAALQEHGGVRQAVVIAREDQPGEKRLVAYVVPEAGGEEKEREKGRRREELGMSQLREYLQGKLPEYMVPSAYVRLEKLPLNHNGKIDRKKLPQPDENTREQEYVGPRNPTEETLCRLWQEVMRVERVGIHDNFFTLGGHSLMAVQVAARLRESFKVEIPLRRMFESPTIAQLAEVIDQVVQTSGRDGAPLLFLPTIKTAEGIRKAVMTTSLSDIQQVPAQEVVFFPASFAQQRLWLLDQLTPGKATYNIDSALRILGKLDVEALERALEEVARRHETLRTRFVAAGGELQQVIEDGVSVELPVVDLTSIAGEEEREAEAVGLAQEEARQPFDLQQAPLFRGKLLRLGELDHVLLFTMHHIISDAWSMGILVEEVSVLYGAFSTGQPSPLPELPVQYADYSVWQRECLEGGLLEGQLAYWKEQLSGVSMLQLPADRPRPTTQSQNGATSDFVMDANHTQGLKKLAEEQGATLFMVLLAAFQILLYRYSGQSDIAVGTPIAGRPTSDTERLIGFFINTLVLRGDLSGAPGFIELLQRTKEVTLEAYAHQDVPFEKLVEVLSPERNMGSTPLFQVMIVLQNAPQSDLRLGAATLQPFNTVDNGTSKFDLLLQFGEDGSGKLMGSLQYSTDLFEAPTIRRLVGHYSRLLSSIVAVPQAPIHGLEILSGEERGLLLVGFNSTATAIAEKTLSELFEEQVERTPNARAIQYEEESLSYIELDQRANQLGHHLRKFGVGPEMRVGICLERSLEMVVSILGVLKAGGTYVPLDPGYPEERLQFMVEDAQVAVLISQRALGERFSQNQAGLIFWEDLCREIEPCSREKVESGVRVDNAAYMIYTSGSTGRPKGVVVTHGNVARLMATTEGWFEFSAQDVWTMFHSYAFDFSVWELWGALLYGGRLEVIPYWVSRSPELFYRLVNERGVTVLNQTPSAFQQFSREDEERGAEGKALQLRLVIFGGEALEMSSLRPWFERHGDKSPRLVNMYGITETTVHVTYKVLTKEIARENASVIGTRIPDLQLYILREMEPVPIGVVGEMYVGGAGLARGYWKRAELTAQRFVPHPFSESGGERLYRTGDLGRFREDGEIEYLGRMDHQVKIRGFRIELGEIEAALQEHESVRHAVVIARENEGGDKRLVAYVVPERESEESNNGSGRVELQINQLREHLLGKLPEYMVPSAYVPLEKLPLNHNGKIDRKSLPEPDKDIPQQEYVGPRNATEETLCRLWQEVLRRERVGIHDNFFNLGGHSLLAVQVVSRIKQAFAVEMPLSHLFTAPTVARMAELIAAVNEPDRSRSSPVLINIQPHGSLPPFFCVHAIGGQVISYGELSQELGHEQPFYGLQSPPANLFPASEVSIEQMAALYIHEIRKIQPVGPYLLGGWSMGGLIALEMARQMVEEGDAIRLLALIDTTPPSEYLDADDKVDEMSMLARFALNMSQLVGRDPGPLVEQFSRAAAQDQWNMVQEMLISYGVLTPMTAHAEMTGLLDVFTRNFLAANNYSLRYSQQPILFFRASETPERFSRLWTRWTGENIQFHSVPGDHFTMLRRPYVSIIAEGLRRCMHQEQRAIFA
jgi:amino acid adenylation domain-containing protein